MQHGTITACWVGSSIVQRIGTTGGGTLAQIAMIGQRKKHEVVVEIVLPKEHLGLLRVIGETHVTRQTLAIDLDVATVGTLQDNTALLTIYHAELCQVALIASMGVIK